MQKVFLKIVLSASIVALVFGGSASQSNYKTIDKIAGNIPDIIENDIDSIVLFIVSKCETETEKARGLFTWIITNIGYDQKSTEGVFPVGRDINDILKSRKAICVGYAKLFEKMCDIAGLECEVISGYSHDNPTSKNTTDAPDHAWNALLLDGQWQLVDATWSASLRTSKQGKRLKPEVDTYFLPPPSSFLITHLPAQPWWQLVSSPVDMQIFRSGPDFIASHLTQNNNYAFNDSISAFRKLPASLKKVREAEAGWIFLPSDKNLKQYMAVLMEYASEITESNAVLQSKGPLDSLIAKQSTLIELCRYTATLGPLLLWQKELFVEALINHVVALHQKVKGKPDKKLKSQLLQLLSEAMTILNETPESYYTKSAKSVCQEILEVIGQ